jgi:hypothetical protein
LVAATLLAVLAGYSFQQQDAWAREAKAVAAQAAELQTQAQEALRPAAVEAVPASASLLPLQEAHALARRSLDTAAQAHGLRLPDPVVAPSSLVVGEAAAAQEASVLVEFNSHQQLLAFVDQLVQAGQRVERVRAQGRQAAITLTVIGATS